MDKGVAIYLVPFLASALYAGQMVCDKLLLSKYKMATRELLPLTFVFLILAPFLVILLKPSEMTTLYTLLTVKWWLLASVLLAVIWNTAYYKAMRCSTLGELELSVLAVPVITPLLAFLVYSGERSVYRLLFAIIAACVVVWAHGDHHQQKRQWSLYHAMFIIGWAAEILIWPQILHTLTPAIYYLIRVTLVALIFIILCRPRLHLITDHHNWRLLIISSLVGGLAMVFLLQSIKSLGVISTLAAVSIAPMFVLLAEQNVLHERVKPRLLFAMLLIIFSAIMAQVASFGR